MDPMDVFFITISVLLTLMMGLLIALFLILNKGLGSALSVMRSLHHELMPVVADMRSISGNVGAISEEARAILFKASKFTDALAGIGQDLEGGRAALKSGLGRAGGWILQKVFKPKELGHDGRREG